MKISTTLLLLTLLLLSGVSMNGAESPGTLPKPKPVYKPPTPVGAPKVRIDAGTRGGADTNLSLSVLAPDHVGLTTRAQPTLYYYVSPAGRTNLVFTLIDNQHVAPLIEAALPPSAAAGIQKIDLARFNAPLATGKDYLWSVAAVPDVNSRSKDTVASGIIRRTEVSPELRERLAGAATNAWSIYAENGIWHDAFAALSDLVEKEPNDKKWRQQRAALLREVGLPEPARSDEDFKTN